MEPESQIVFTPPTPAPITTTPITPPPDRQLIAPLWHTVLLLLLFLGVSYFGATHKPTPRETAPPERDLILQYSVTIAFEFFLLLVVWVGLKLRGMRLIDFFKGRWERHRPMKLRDDRWTLAVV